MTLRWPGTSGNRWTGSGIAPATMLTLLVIFALAKACSLGVYCADDAYFGIVAKNLASGLGYGTGVDGDGFVLFDSEIGLGPVMVLPVAAVIGVVGNRSWVPGFVTVAMWSTLCIILFHVVRRTSNDLAVAAHRDAGVLFLAGMPLIFPYHFEQWSSLLGEVPTALFLLVAFATLSGPVLSASNVVIASFVCSLAVLTKMVALPGYVALVVSLTIRLGLVDRRGLRATAWLVLVSNLAFIAPILIFEATKAISFGSLQDYAAHLQAKLSFVKRQGLSGGGRGELLRRLTEHDQVVLARFGLSVVQSLIVVAGALFVITRSRHRSLLQFAVPAALVIVLTAVWFLCGSQGRPRYYVIPMILTWSLVAAAVAAIRSWWRLPMVVMALATLLSLNYAKMPYLLYGLENGWFQPSDELRNSLHVANEVDTILDDPANETVFITQWWATTADIEYYSRYANVFTKFNELEPRAPFLVVYNRRFVNLQDKSFSQLLERCEGPADPAASHVVLRSKQARMSPPAVNRSE